MQAMLETLEKDLADESRYNIPRIKRVVRNANTLAAVAIVLGNHDQTTPLKEAAVPISKASLALAAQAKDYEAASAALQALKKVIATLPKGPLPALEATGDIEQLMLQVPILERELGRRVRGTAFAKSRDQAAALSATLAAVAQVSELDHTYCSDTSDQRDWDQLCQRMRDAAAECNRAIRAGERVAAKNALKRLNQSCDACHDRFRD
jgi:hypothetical protein